MKYNRLSFLSVFIALGIVPSVTDAGIRVGNASRNNAQAYQQVSAQKYQQEQAAASAAARELPVKVTDPTLEALILAGDTSSGVTEKHLENCKMVYPTGVFEWSVPTIGFGVGGMPTCTSVVELRAMGQGENGSDLVLARANLAAGASFDCNISNFPESSWLDAAGTVQVPADRQPTVEDVKKVMDEEQKQNAAIKIISGVVLGGLMGNIAGKNDPGKDGIFGASKEKLITTAVGAAGGAGLVAASSYSGKVAGDMILSTGINAAAGAVMGNVAASGESRMRIEKCKIAAAKGGTATAESDTSKTESEKKSSGKETSCLWGYLQETGDLGGKEPYVSVGNINNFRICNTEGENCEYADLTNVVLNSYSGKTLKQMYEDEFKQAKDSMFCYKEGKMQKYTAGEECPNNEIYVKLDSANKVTARTPVMIADVADKPVIGYKSKDWSDADGAKLKGDVAKKKLYRRSASGAAEEEIVEENWIDNFEVMYVDASDGGVIDMSNKARAGGTLVGAGIGGAAGAFTAYQGAQSEIDERWVAAVREYKDSLQKFYCGTGQRFLSFYNDTMVIPAMAEVEEE
ncbi:MAG: hypothetical protein IKZ34_02020 [Alphaproteobacteria bacterium]|nr:hypothetical protein [Alphaproteobacteria bacterium]